MNFVAYFLRLCYYVCGISAPPLIPLLLYGGLQFGALAQLDVRGACRRVESKNRAIGALAN